MKIFRTERNYFFLAAAGSSIVEITKKTLQIINVFLAGIMRHDTTL
jgi:hypothetical protein